MPLWKIAWRSIQRRSLASFLTACSMALGVMLVVAILLLHGVVADSFMNNSSLGYDMIIGAKGGRLQLVLNTVFYLSQPVENIPIDFYEEFLPAEQRADGRAGKFLPYVDTVVPVCLGDFFQNYRVVGTTPELFNFVYDAERQRAYEFAEGRNFRRKSDEFGFNEAVIGSKVARETGLKVGETIRPSHGAPDGKSHDEFHIVGILASSGTPVDRGVFINMEGFNRISDHLNENSFAANSEPVVASELETVGDIPRLVHRENRIEWPRKHGYRQAEAVEYDDGGNPDIPGLVHESRYYVIFVDEHSISLALTEQDAIQRRAIKILGESSGRHKLVKKEVTALLVDTKGPMASLQLKTTVNEGLIAQAVLPIAEIYGLFDLIVKPIQSLLLFISILICVVSGISILVSIYNSMSDRRHEIAVMRSLGAGRRTVMVVVLLESIILAMAGGIMGWLGGHMLVGLLSQKIEDRTGVTIGAFDLSPPIDLGYLFSMPFPLRISAELLLVPGVITLAILVGLMPALAAYRTDVAKALSATP